MASNPAAVRIVSVATGEAGQRLDNFLLARLKGVPRSHVYRIVRRGEVRVNAARTRPDYRLRAGDRVRIPPLRTARRAVPRVSAALERQAQRVLYEDEHLLILDKQAGVTVHAGSGVTAGVIETLRQLRPHTPYLELVHRLDRDTSGCLVLAKSRTVLNALHALLRDPTARGIDKRYLALVEGRWPARARSVAAALDSHRLRSGERVTAVADTGRAAHSRFSVRERFAHCTLVEIALLTGRTHQARVHAAHAGHPVAGDTKYGSRGFDRELRALGLRRLFLHASSVAFRHPASGERLHVHSPLPDELAAVVTRLRALPRVASGDVGEAAARGSRRRSKRSAARA